MPRTLSLLGLFTVFLSVIPCSSYSGAAKSSSPHKFSPRRSFIREGAATVFSLGLVQTVSAATPEVDASGMYSDPNHPKGFRLVKINGKDVTVVGSDIGETPEWELKGKREGASLFIDFTPKGYPKTLEAKFDGSGLSFPDGNRWPKTK